MSDQPNPNTIPQPPPTIGRIVHYVLKEGRSKGQVRAATIVRVWDSGVVNLQVHLDGSNDAGAEGIAEVTPTPQNVMVGSDGSRSGYVPLTSWVGSVAYNNAMSPEYGNETPNGSYQPGTWHYLPRV